MQIFLVCFGDPVGWRCRTCHVVFSGFARRGWPTVPAETWLSRDVSHFKMLASALRRMYMAPAPRKWSVRNMLLSTVPLLISWPWSSETKKRDRRRTQPRSWAPQLTSPWSEPFLVVLFCHDHEGNDKARKGEARGPALRNESLQWRESTAPRCKRGTSRHRSEGIFPPPQLRDFPVWSSCGLTGGQTVT